MPFGDDERRQRGSDRKLTYDPGEHNKGDWFREQITDDGWNDFECDEVGGLGNAPTKYVRGFKRA
jgi:hypothetical protein